jgi:hypothetical protein
MARTHRPAARQTAPAIETKFLHWRQSVARGDVMPEGWRMCGLGGGDKGRVWFVVMVLRKHPLPARRSV